MGPAPGLGGGARVVAPPTGPSMAAEGRDHVEHLTPVALRRPERTGAGLSLPRMAGVTT